MDTASRKMEQKCNNINHYIYNSFIYIQQSSIINLNDIITVKSEWKKKQFVHQAATELWMLLTAEHKDTSYNVP